MQVVCESHFSNTALGIWKTVLPVLKPHVTCCDFQRPPLGKNTPKIKYIGCSVQDWWGQSPVLSLESPLGEQMS